MRNPETGSDIKFEIVPPQGDKHHMVAFDAKTPKEARAYNDSLCHHLQRIFYNIFHQVGGENNETGRHMWEIWDADIDEVALMDLLVEAEEDAQILMQEDDLDILVEKIYKPWSEHSKAGGKITPIAPSDEDERGK